MRGARAGVLVLCATLIGSPIAVRAGDAMVERGRAIVTQHCSRCHAVGKEGDSPHREAPPFRTLGQRYPIESLAEALAEGIVTGHPDMPEFTFEPPEISAILSYLESLGGRPYQ